VPQRRTDCGSVQSRWRSSSTERVSSAPRNGRARAIALIVSSGGCRSSRSIRPGAGVCAVLLLGALMLLLTGVAAHADRSVLAPPTDSMCGVVAREARDSQERLPRV
jgi:hypothetical protein